jgi:hypothetical protein
LPLPPQNHFTKNPACISVAPWNYSIPIINHKETIMAQTIHTDAAKSHENAAKAHHEAAALHGKSDAKAAVECAQKAHGLSEDAHKMSKQAATAPTIHA